MKKQSRLKKGLAILLTAAMVAGLVPAMPGGAVEVQAATENGTGSTPSVTAYATKEQMMDGTFAPNESGEATNYGKLVFGQDEEGNAQEWYILGKDTGVSGDNTIIFATSPIATEQVFSSDISNKKNNNLWSDCVYSEATITEVYPNHYGASDLRGALKSMATNTSYFTTAEQGLMNKTTVTTKDKRNGKSYTTTDTLYALAADGSGSSYTTIKAGSDNSTVLAMSSYWNSGSWFWLRSPHDDIELGALHAFPGNYVDHGCVDNVFAVQPASNLNLSSVLFASAASSPSSDTAESRTIADGTAMTLRLDGTGKNIGLVTYNTTTGDIKATKGSTTCDVAVVVQGNDGTKDWYYSKKITATETVNVSAIASESNTPASIDLSTCKIWLEITDTDGLIYAVGAEKEIEPINTTYVTKEQLMNSFKPYSDGTAANYGKLVFGKNQSGTAQEWYILGQDTGVSGDNTLIFAVSPIATNQKFEDDWQSNKTYDSSFGVYTSNPTDVYPNHYGASDLRVALKNMATNASYFTSAEQGLMNATTVKTNDTNNSVSYTTTDKLYALAADGSGATTIKAGTSDSTVLAMSSYWSNGSWFWLRSPYDYGYSLALLAEPGDYVNYGNVSHGYAVQPASNLNLSSVLFASAATAASSDTVVADTIASDTAMTLRLDGSNTAIGMAYYDAGNGVIVADRAAGAAGAVSLVVQGNDGTNDWYYSVQVEGRTIVKVDDIKKACTLSGDINLTDCYIWLEISDTDERMIYAKPAESKGIAFIDNVAVTGMKPVGGTAFNTTASCSTTGIATTAPAITYTTTGDSSEVEVTGNADWNTTYKTNVTLGTGIVDDVVYVFGDSVSVTVDGEAQSDSFAPNVDGTVTVIKEFTTAKRKIVSVTKPDVPTDNTFTTYYGYEGYNEVLSDVGNSELGKQAMVTLEGTALVASTTEAMDVTWAIANADNAEYDRTLGATNTFRWTIPASEFPDYDASVCQGYDAATGNITDTVTITNKAATPVTITGTDSSVAYTGETIDVSQYFTIDSHAGAATYSLVTGADGGTGEGTLSGTILTVTKTGTFKIKVDTAANGIYAAGEKLITLTVDNGTIEYTATDYSGTYDGQPHSISVNVSNPAGTTVTYSTDGVTYGSDNPSFRDEGRYTVYYRITKDNYTTVEGAKTVTINKKAVTPQPPKKGDVVKDDKGTGNYKVTDVAKKEVAYQTPANKKATTISIPVTVTIDGITYKVTSVAASAFANNKKITKVTIGSNVKSIGKQAFYGCTNLKTVTIGKNVTTIGASAFYGCSKLTTVTIGANVTTIGDKAFCKCTALTKITIPSKVKTIGKQAFYGCKKLKTITIKTTKLTSKNVGSSAFKGIYAKATIKVPKSKLAAYKKLFKSKGLSSKVNVKGV